MVILDTNVISEMMRASPDPNVVEWYLRQDSESLWTTAVTVAEIFYGLNLLPAGSRRERLVDFAKEFFLREVEGKILPFDESAARHYADMRAEKRQRGMSMSPLDAQIAAIARAAGAAVVTRNIADFEQCGIKLIDPWKS